MVSASSRPLPWATAMGQAGDAGSELAVERGEQFQHGLGGGMALVLPPAEPYGDRLAVAHRPVDDTGPWVLVGGRFRRHADAAARGDHGEPVVHVVRLLGGRAGV